MNLGSYMGFNNVKSSFAAYSRAEHVNCGLEVRPFEIKLLLIDRRQSC